MDTPVSSTLCPLQAEMEDVVLCMAQYRGIALCLEIVLMPFKLQRPKNQKKNTINYHLSRMYPNIVGPRKRN